LEEFSRLAGLSGIDALDVVRRRVVINRVAERQYALAAHLLAIPLAGIIWAFEALIGMERNLSGRECDVKNMLEVDGLRVVSPSPGQRRYIMGFIHQAQDAHDLADRPVFHFVSGA